jgi:hypothetical protein
MANPHRGEVDLIVGDRTYVLRMSINEIAQLESLLDKGVQEISAILGNDQDVRIGAWRAALWASLQANHKGLTLEDAGDIMGEAGMPEVMAKVGEALQLAFPSNEGGQKPNPRKASRAGTGKH